MSTRKQILTCVFLVANFGLIGVFVAQRAFAIPAPNYICCPDWPTNVCGYCWVAIPPGPGGAGEIDCYDPQFDGYSLCQSGGSYTGN
jgi:hypothetical protein